MRAPWLLALCLLAAPALAHESSDAYLSLAYDGAATLGGRWDIALRDLELAVGVDADADGRITWGELQARRAEIEAHALSRLRIEPCALRVRDAQVDRHAGGAYVVLWLTGTCSDEPRELSYELLFALDPSHRGLLRFERGGETQSAVLSPGEPRAALGAGSRGAWRTLGDFAREGVWHIWLGFDHVLFLLSLLLPAAFVRARREWRPVERARGAFAETLRVVTAFTLSHSLTLGLAAFGALALPSRQVESAIAASVVLAALDNVVPILRAPRWAIAFGFGLVHGLGFASVLAGLGLPASGRALALAGFNAGVELGQLALVAAFLPPALALRRTAGYRRIALVGGSLAIAAVACVWLVERTFAA
jgi:hypothetical protein